MANRGAKAALLVNLTDYLDTGRSSIIADAGHRPMIEEQAGSR